jgi:hypothetical protein
MGGPDAVLTPLPADDRGPRLRALLVLVLASLAILATSPAIPTLEGYVIGDVTMGPNESVQRDLHVHVDPAGGGAARGSITARLQAAHGLGAAFSGNVQISLDGGTPFPVERCLEGCDLDQQVAIATGDGMLPGSVIRYEVYVRLEYEGTWGPKDPQLLRIDLAGATGGPIAPLWSILAGVVALLAGWFAAPRIHAALPVWRRAWPAFGLIGLMLAPIVWSIGERAVAFASQDVFARFGGQPIVYLALVDPWSVGLLGTLAWGIRIGTLRWSADGGELLGIAAVAAVGLGGLWLAYTGTTDAALQPLLLGAQFVALGGIGGVVIAQAWRTAPPPIHDPWWTSAAVLAHGIVLAGFGFLAPLSVYDPSGNQMSLLILVPLAFVAWAFRRWLRGRQRWLVFFDLLIALTGLLGLFLLANPVGGSFAPDRVELDDVGVWIAVAAALVAFVTACHSRRPPVVSELTASQPDPPRPGLPPGPLAVDDPPAR